MSAPKKLNIKQLIVYIAEYHQREISTPVVMMYAADYKGFAVQEIYKAWEVYRGNPKNYMMPTPAQLKAIANPAYDVENVPRLIVEDLMCAVSDRGGYWEPEPEELIEEVGELGAKVIERLGGWRRFVNSFGNVGSLENHKAQIRNVAKSIMEMSMSGHVDTKFALPKPQEERSEKTGMISLDKLLTHT